jgi:hypothetical protein
MGSRPWDLLLGGEESAIKNKIVANGEICISSVV